jgi:ADP-heptose:LPS heptosyltransferase
VIGAWTMLPLRLRLLKRLDHSVGAWLCRRVRPAFAGRWETGGDVRPVWRGNPVPKAGIARILVIRPGGIGDAVLTFPMLRALRECYDEASIDVLGERRNADVYRINGLVREVYCYDAGPLASSRLLRELAARRYPLIVDTEQYHHFSAVTANYLHPTYICGFDTVGRGRLQTHRVRYTDSIYEVYSFLRLAETLIGHPVPFERDQPFLEVDARWRDWAAQALAGHDQRPIAVIVPGASTPHKYWPPQRYAAVATWLIERGYYVVILGGRDALTLARVIATHHGVGTPTVHMFGSGIMEKWAPQGRRYVVVHKDLPCSPCTRYGSTPPCPYGVACMQAIQVEDVIAAIEEVLRR